MLKKLIIVTGVVTLLLPFSVGCTTTEPVMWSWPHHKRRLLTITEGFHKLHMDIDRIVFDMEEYPIEADY